MIRYSLPVTLITATVTGSNERPVANTSIKFTRDYATNDSGEGLFVWSDCTWRQLLGNSQFSASDRTAMLRKTREYRTETRVAYTAAATAEDEAERDAYYAQFAE